MYQNVTYNDRFLTVFIKAIICMVFFGVFIYGQTSRAQSPNPVGNSLAQKATKLFEQGKTYHDGDGVSVDMGKALDFYERASAIGSSDARVNLGYMYFTGEGVPQNYSVARQYYLQAANAGDRSAQKNLGLMYAHGIGVNIDKKLSQKWYNKSTGKKPPAPKTITKTAAVAQTAKPKPKTIQTVQATQTKAPIVNKTVNTKKIEPAMSTTELAGAKTQKQSIAPEIKASKIGNMVDTATTGEAAKPKTQTNTVKTGAYILPKGVQGLTQVITGQKAQAAELSPKFIGLKTRGTSVGAGIWMGPKWFRPLLFTILLLMATISTLWFITNMRKFKLERARRRFAERFFASYRDSIRGSYLRTPESHRQFERPYEPWAMTLSALMVRFATNRDANPNIKCEVSSRVVTALNASPYTARMEVFKLIDMVQDRLYMDIEYLNTAPAKISKPFQFGHSVMTARKKRKNKSQIISKLRLVK